VWGHRRQIKHMRTQKPDDTTPQTTRFPPQLHSIAIAPDITTQAVHFQFLRLEVCCIVKIVESWLCSRVIEHNRSME